MIFYLTKMQAWSSYVANTSQILHGLETPYRLQDYDNACYEGEATYCTEAIEETRV